MIGERDRGNRSSLAMCWLCLSVVAMTPTTSLAQEQHRFALVIGANQGASDEETLLYAERDAVRIADTLTRLGGVSEERLVLLRGPSAATVRRALRVMTRRIAAVKLKSEQAKTMLMVYYSGHAGAEQMHLGDTVLSFKALTEGVKGTGADVNLIVVDACRSGGLTRVKGGVPTQPFEIRSDNKLDSVGLAIIASSAAGEDAQESDKLRGGIFTHHLIMGLSGAADNSGDSQVTLSELYRYTYAQTIRTTSRTRFVQHPTYSFKMKGRQEVVVAHLANARGLGRLSLMEKGAYILLKDTPNGAIVAEFESAGKSNVMLPPGRYLVRRRSQRAVYEATVAVKRDKTTQVLASNMSHVPYGRTVRKGHSSTRRVAWSLALGGGVAGPILQKTSVVAQSTIGLQLDLAPVSLNLRVQYGHASAENSDLQMSQNMVGVDLGAYKLFDIPRVPVDLGLGVRLGGDWVHQHFDTKGKAPDKASFAWRVAPVVRMGLALGSMMYLSVDGGADVYLLNALQTSGDGEWVTRVVPFGALNLGFYLP